MKPPARRRGKPVRRPARPSHRKGTATAAQGFAAFGDAGSVQTILDAETRDEKKREELVGLGLPPTVRNAILLGLSEKATEGNTSAAKSLRELLDAGSDDNAAPETMDLTALTDEELRALAGRLRNGRQEN